jgi:hypothetical protein
MATNIYANKVYKENPCGLWVLDEDLSVGLIDLPGTINLSTDGGTTLRGVPADSYGLESDYGYYVHLSGMPPTRDLCFNDGLPILYGSVNSTSIYSGEGYIANYSEIPSLIVPGKGFMHDFGKNKNITVEFWTKIFCNDNVIEKKIFGPINSTDGLYVNDGFLTLKIANAVRSHYVGEWGRPMLIGISYNSEKVSMTINGAQVMLLDFDIARATFNTDAEDDWLGFYADADIPVISVDCISIYPYNLSVKQAKLHFIYGQAIEEPESKNTEINDLPIIIDYEMSKNAGNHNYPDHSSWSDGYLTNLSINNKQLCSPNFEIPRVSFNNKDANEADWLYANKLNNIINEDLNPSQTDLFFRLKPRDYDEYASGGPEYLSTYWTDQANFLVEDFKIGSRRADAFYLTGMADRFIASTTETIVDIVDDLDNRFSIQIVYPESGPNATIQYVYNGTVFDGTPEPNISFTVTASTMFSVGLNIRQFTDFVDNQDVEEFFADPESLIIYFGGSYNYSSTFSGRVYSFGLLSSTDIQNIEGVISDASIFSNGTLNSGVLGSSIESLITFVGGFTIKPTVTFDVFDIDASSVGYWSDIVPLKILSKEVDEDYVIDYIQLNIDYPDFETTTDAAVRSYITFLNIDETETMPTDLIDVSVPANGIIDATNWATRRYEFVNGNIVKVPQAGSVDSELSMKIELEIVNVDISRNPLKIRRVEISSRAFDTAEIIGTRSGKDVSVNGANSFARLYKRSSPYLYLSKNSGIKLVNSANTYDGTSHIMIPINDSFAENYFITAIQFAFRSGFELEQDEVYQVAKFSMPNGDVYDMTLTGDNNGLPIATIDLDAVPSTVTTILINGQDTDVVKPYEWNMITIAFDYPLNFGNLNSSATYGIKLTGNFSYDNVSFYQIPDQKLSQVVIYDTWSEYDTELNWNNLDGDNNAVTTATWEEVAVEAVIPGGNVSFDAEAVYLSYIGGLRLSNDPITNIIVFPGSNWSSYNGYNQTVSTYKPL